MGDLSNWIGTILQTLSILGTVGWFLFRMHLDLKIIAHSQQVFLDRVSKIEDSMKQLNQVVVDIARQDVRLNNFESRIQEISNRVFEHIKRESVG